MAAEFAENAEAAETVPETFPARCAIARCISIRSVGKKRALMGSSRPPICSRPIAVCLAITLSASAWAEQPAFRGSAKATLREVPNTEDSLTPPQKHPPKSPTQFNPDPGATGGTPAVAHPKAKPPAEPPNSVLKKPDETKPALPKPEAPKPAASALDLGEVGTPQVNPTNPANPAAPGLVSDSLAPRDALFGDEFFYPRFDNKNDGLTYPRRGVRSQIPQSNIFHYREYPMGQEKLGLLPNSAPMESRWAIPYPKWVRYLDPSHEVPYPDGRDNIRWWHPYTQSKLKGDTPIIGQDIFLNITLKDFALFEYRRLPIPSGVSAATPNSSEFFGRGEQRFISNDQSISFEIFKGETAFKPVEWLFRAQVVKNDNWIWVQEQNLLDPDPRGIRQVSGGSPKISRIGANGPSGQDVNSELDGAKIPGTVLRQGGKVISPGDLFNYIYPQLKPAGAPNKFVRVDPLTNDPVHGSVRAQNRPENPDHEKDFQGTRNTYRHKDFVALQEFFFEYHLGDKSDNYDFLSSRVGIQPFVSDFRGFIFNDTNLGARLFGNADNNRIQYNVLFFDMLEKDTYSGLNTFDMRDQQVFIANVFRQDLFFKGYTGQLSFHANFDNGQTHFDKNDFLVRPAPLGDFVKEHDIRSYYLGWTGDGHIGRFNINHAFYWALGEDEANGLAGRRVAINAQMAALELSYDRDWIRYKLSGFWASGDGNPTDDRGEGFDSIVDAPFFVGGPFSWYVHEGINLAGTAVNLKNPDSLLMALRSSKNEGQSNFVNPGVKILGFGIDADITPRLRGFINANYIWFDKTEPIQTALLTNKVSDQLGFDLSFGIKYRPLLTDNIIVGTGVGLFFPGDGYKDIYRRNTDLVDNSGPKNREGKADDVLWNVLLTLTVTF